MGNAKIHRTIDQKRVYWRREMTDDVSEVQKKKKNEGQTCKSNKICAADSLFLSIPIQYIVALIYLYIFPCDITSGLGIEYFLIKHKLASPN